MMEKNTRENHNRGCVQHHLYIEPVLVHAEAGAAAHQGLYDAVAVQLQQGRLRLWSVQPNMTTQIRPNIK